MDNIIIGKLICMVPISLEDTELIVRWRNNPLVKHNFIFREVFTNEMHNSWMNNKVATGKVVQFIIQDNATKKKIGSVYLRDIDYNFRSAEYGIFIGEDEFRGKGFGSEAAKLIVDYAFKNLKLHRVFLRVFKNNEVAISSYKRVGFKIEGIARDMVYLDNCYNDVVFMSMINSEEVE